MFVFNCNTPTVVSNTVRYNQHNRKNISDERTRIKPEHQEKV
jgi:hypothetical protein